MKIITCIIFYFLFIYFFLLLLFTAGPTYDPAAPILTTLIVAKTRSTITLNVTFAAAAYSGTVYCAAFANGANVTTVSEVITTGAQVRYLVGASAATVKISGLKSVVDYDVYCAAVTVNGVMSRAADVRATKSDAQTDC